jgi:uncharacterized membrane protein
MQKILYWWDKLLASFWFIPILIILFVIGAAIGLIYLDHLTSYTPEGMLKYLFPGSVESARSVLTIIAGAMIGVAGTVFSITLVALTLATSQFGSRLLRNFMYDKLNQVVLGVYVSSFVYCLLVLNAIKETGDLTFVPAISVFAAMAAAIACIILLIIFIHHISISIQSDKVISEIATSMSKHVEKLFPASIGHEELHPPVDMEKEKAACRHHHDVLCTKDGYLQSVDSETLLDLASKNDWIIELHFRPGDYLVKGTRICNICSKEPCGEEAGKKVFKAFIIGKVRTPLQDAEFSIHQMVEVASRALSPGVNDPYTATACIDNLGSVMCYLARAHFPSPYRFDEEDRLRVIANNLTFSGMMDAAFNQIRQYGEGNPAVLIRLMETLVTINGFIRSDEKKQEVTRHAKMVLHAARRGFTEPNDLKDLEARFKKLKYKKTKSRSE